MLVKLDFDRLLGDGYVPPMRPGAHAGQTPLAGGTGQPPTKALLVVTNGDDTLIGGDLGDLIEGKGGNDSLQGQRDDDTPRGGRPPRSGRGWRG